MKVYIKSNHIQQDSNTYEIDVEVVYKLVGSGAIAASIDTNLTGQALMDFDGFVTVSISIIEACGFKYLNCGKSDRKGSISEYYTFTKKDDISGKTIKCVLIFRVSDHALDNDPSKRVTRSHYYKNTARGDRNKEAVLYDGFSWELVTLTSMIPRIIAIMMQNTHFGKWLRI